jgi:hypothetical protein
LEEKLRACIIILLSEAKEAAGYAIFIGIGDEGQ